MNRKEILKKITQHIYTTLLLCCSTSLGNIYFSSPQSAVSLSGGSLYVQNTTGNWDGTLDIRSGSVSGSILNFSRGIYTTSQSEGYLTGQLDFSGSQKVFLNGSQRLRGAQGFFVPQTFVGGIGNVIEGAPIFLLPVTLNTNAAELQLNVQSKLNRNIILNGGTVKLLDDINLADDVTFSGSGLVNLNYRRINFPALTTTWNSSIVWTNPSDIVLNARTVLSSIWTLSGNAVLNGNGNILDLSSGGTLLIQNGASVQLTDVHIRGLGSTLGTLLFQSKTSELRLSNCTLEFSSSYTLTTGGIYVEGDKSVLITGTNSLTLNANASMTVDRVTLFADTLDATSTVYVFPNIPNTLNLMYRNNGIMRALGAGGVSGGDTALGLATSNAVAGLLVAVSNAVSTMNTLNNANSSAIVAINTLNLANSSAIVFANSLAVFNSHAIKALSQGITDNSNVIVGWVKDTSNAINNLRPLVVNTSNAVNGLLVSTSNAVAGLLVSVSNAVSANNTLLVSTSNAVAGLLVSVSNAVSGSNTLNNANSSAIVAINTLNLANSSAIVFANSLAVFNSNAIKALSQGITDNSNAIVGWAKDTSNAINNLRPLIINTSNAVNGLLVSTSNAVAGLLVSVSNAVSANNTLLVSTSNAVVSQNNLLVNTSNALVALSNAVVASNSLAIDNSNAIVGWVKDTSNAINNLRPLVVNTSNAVNGLLVSTSNAVVSQQTLLQATSNALVALSNAVVASNSLAIDNSNVIVGWAKDTSNAINNLRPLIINTSNAVNGLLVSTSNAVAGLLVSVSNVVSANNTLLVSTSNAVVSQQTLLQATSNALVALSNAVVASNSLAIDNSNVIVGWVKDTSNAINNLYPLVVNTSNAVNGLLVSTSNAVAGLLVSVSNAVSADHAITVGNSNAIVSWIAGTSQAVANFVLVNSQAIVTINNLNLANSYAIIAINTLNVANSYGVVALRELAVATSDALLANQALDIQTSNAVVTINNALTSWVKDTSNAVAGLLVSVSNAVSADHTLLVNTSNALVTLSNQLTSANGLAIDNSNAIVSWIKDTSNVVVSLYSNVQKINNELQTIDHGPAAIHFNASTITMSYAHNISTDHLLYVHASGVIDGATHAINFTTSTGPIFIVDAGMTVTVQNILLNGFASDAVTLGSGAQLLLGEGTIIKLDRAVDIQQTWSFVGNAVIDGQGNVLNLGIADAIIVNNGKSVQLQNVILDGLGSSSMYNMRILGPDGSLVFNNAHLLLDSEYRFTMGSLLFNHETIISGSGRTFVYSSASTSTIAGDAVLTFDKGLTWSYDSVAAKKDCLYFASSTASLHLNSCTIHATHTGLHLSNGTLIIDDKVLFRNEAINEAEASILSSSLSTYVLGGATLEIGNGIILYQ